MDSKRMLKRLKLGALKGIVRAADFLSLTRRHSFNKPRNCLIISSTGVGDTIWGTPAIRALKTKYPECRISVLTSGGGRQVLLNNPYIDGIYVTGKGLLHYFSLLRDIRRACFDTVIVFHCSDRMTWLTAPLSGAGRIIGSNMERHHKGMDFVMTDPVRAGSSHAIYERQLLTAVLNVRGAEEKMDLFLSDEERAAVSKDIIDNKVLVGFQPGASRLFQRWPAKNFIALGKMLKASRADIEIIVTGSHKEKPLVDAIAGEVGGISLAGLSIRDTAVWMERCTLFISNDTGPMHISVALGTPTIALCAATGTESCVPYKGTPAFRSIEKPKPCARCEAKSCEDPVCMEQITPEEVFRSAKEMLDTYIV